ncbi:glycosyltransferase family protein [Pararhodospirillum oryzae]|uniref:Uncharacterized protein n=1 Tax=Pararhodospirillum oryzae TaxID=478448 RepID=A0A512H558_9PROT|nr:glycosyltransferase [Pararhodospirillum oryzae]GEO80581.1 hypothetical protein ROR02_07120 [Pararhodospirillum oryzae]
MKIALVDAFPNRPRTAEREFIRRSVRALANLGWSGHSVVTSDEILALEPDVVIATHEFIPKVTPFPTIGLMWSPPAFFRDDPFRIRALRSYDGYFTGSDFVTRFLEDQLFAMDKNAPIVGPFLPTCYATPFVGAREVKGLFYVGANWDSRRHGNLFSILEKRIPLRVHGPRDRWTGLRRGYVGELPFDGEAVLSALRASGAALCLNRREHNEALLPSARLFEAAAAGVVAITDPLPIIRETFGDTVFYMPDVEGATDRAAAVVELWREIRTNPGRAREMARAAHQVFVEKFSLEKMYEPLPQLVAACRASGGWQPHPMTDPLVPAPEEPTTTLRASGVATPVIEPPKEAEAAAHSDEAAFPTVEYIVRVGGRPVPYIRRCLQALADQTWPNLAVVMVRYRAVEGLDGLLDEFRERFRWIKVVDQHPLNGQRSTTLWCGLRAVSAPYFANQDDDDTMHPNHVAAVMDTLRRHPGRLFAYSGAVRHEEEAGHYVFQENFGGEGKQVVPETRELKFLHPHDRQELYRGHNYIQSNAWIAAREILREDVLKDPYYEVGEDVYLYMLFSRHTDFAASWRPTIQWNWRSTSRDNSMFDEEKWHYIGYRTGVRLQYDLPPRPPASLPEQVVEVARQPARNWVKAFAWHSMRFFYHAWRARAPEMADKGKLLFQRWERSRRFKR